MTCADILKALRVELAASLETIDRLRVHDARVQGQRESLAHIQTVLFNLSADLTEEVPLVVASKAESEGGSGSRVRTRAAASKSAARRRR
jgi:hypothetical protein